jgi:uncharacterized protein (DUF488 family)
VPRSRRNPQYEQRALAASLAEERIHYHHEPGLGGFRKPRPDSINTGWQEPAFQGYADYMATAEFTAALDELQQLAQEHATSMMCAEAQWWRCHRRLISDALVVRGWDVLHLGLKPRPVPHELTPFAVVAADKSLSYPPAQREFEL